MTDKISFPFWNEAKIITIPEWGTFELKPFQILVFVSLTEPGQPHCEGAPVVPALLDTGNSLSFTVHENQFNAAKPFSAALTLLGRQFQIRDFTGKLHKAKAYSSDVWIHGYRYESLPVNLRVRMEHGILSYRISLANEGIACFGRITKQVKHKKFTKFAKMILKLINEMPVDEEQEFVSHPRRLRDSDSSALALPHLPLLGLRAFCLGSLKMEIACTPIGGSITIYRLHPKNGVA